MKKEIVKFLGEDFERETFESLTERKASDMEYALNGFIQIHEQPERLNPEDAKVAKSLPDSLNWCDPTSVCDSLNTTNK